MDIRETIRKNLKYYLERSPYTQAEIARALGVSKMSVTKWMKGDNSPNMEPHPRTDEIPQHYFNIVWGILSI